MLDLDYPVFPVEHDSILEYAPDFFPSVILSCIQDDDRDRWREILRLYPRRKEATLIAIREDVPFFLASDIGDHEMKQILSHRAYSCFSHSISYHRDVHMSIFWRCYLPQESPLDPEFMRKIVQSRIPVDSEWARVMSLRSSETTVRISMERILQAMSFEYLLANIYVLDTWAEIIATIFPMIQIVKYALANPSTVLNNFLLRVATTKDNPEVYMHDLVEEAMKDPDLTTEVMINVRNMSKSELLKLYLYKDILPGMKAKFSSSARFFRD